MTAETFTDADRETDVMTVEQVAARLQVTRRTVDRMIAEGRLRACRMGRSIVRVTEKQLADFLEGDQS